MTKQFIHLIWVLCFAFTACKKGASDTNTDQTALEPIKTDKGAAIGSPASKIIGPGGGELVSSDGKLKVVVTAGTVSSNTQFSIQPITNTLFENENRIAYRLLPEGTTFTKPVELVFHYSNDDTINTTEDLLTIATQQADGSWKIVPAKLNKSAKALTVETTHFSDWTITGGLYLRADRSELGLGQKTMIEVVSVWDEDVLAPLGPMLYSEDRSKLESIDNWKMVDGIGSISVETGQLGKLQTEAEYTAPADMTPNRRTMTIAVDVKGYNLIKDPAAPGGKRLLNKIILTKRIAVVKEYMKAVIGGTTHLFAGSNVIAITGTTSSSLLIGGRNDDLDLDIQILGDSVGTYNCNNDNGVQAFFINGPRSFSTMFLKCNGAGVGFSGALIKLEKVGDVGGWIEGKFTGSLFDNNANACSGPVPTVNVEIEFNVIRRS